MRLKIRGTILLAMSGLATGGLITSCQRGPGGLWGGRSGVAVEPVQIEEREQNIIVAATLLPSEEAKIELPLEVQVDRIFVGVGDTVSVGDPLFHIAEEDLQRRLPALRAESREQEALLEKNNFYYRNRDKFLAEGRIDQAQYDGLGPEIEAVGATLERLKTELSGLEAASPMISSPAGGVITSKAISIGATAPARQTLLKIVKIDPVILQFLLAASEVQAIVKELPISFRLEDLAGQNFQTTVSYISPELDPATKTFEVRAVIPNREGFFKSGMKGEVSFKSPQKLRAVVIPKKALVYETPRYFVYAVREGKAARVRVFPKEFKEDWVEIPEGLREDDVVVVKGQENLKDEMLVEIWK